MRVALVHDYLNQLGGGERVLDELLHLFPHADLYTLLHDEVKTHGRYSSRISGTSFLDVQFARDHHRLFIPLMPLAASRIDLGDKYDLIISDTAGFAKGIRYDKTKTKHLSYIHTPLRYAWETENYFDNSPKNVALKITAAPLFAYVRHWDFWAGQQPDALLANSRYIAGKVRQYYGREAQVLYPPVDTKKFHPNGNDGRYYLAAGRLLHYKRFDLIIKAFAYLNLPLKIIGTGPLFNELSTLARELGAANIVFLGFIKDDEKLRELYQNAKAFVMANEEDFGLVTAEAQACGVPAIAYSAGGSLEIVENGKTGVFFNEQTPQALMEAVKKFEKMKFDRSVIARHAQQFSREAFEKGIREAVKKIL